MAAWCEAPHPCFNWLFVSSSRWGKEGWLSQLTCWLWVALPSRIALYLLQPIDPAADFRHHWILLQMNSEIIQASPIVVTELNSTIETIFLATPLSWVPQGKGGGEKKAPKACLPPFSSFQSSWEEEIHVEKSLKNGYKDICPQMQNNRYQNIP